MKDDPLKLGKGELFLDGTPIGKADGLEIQPSPARMDYSKFVKVPNVKVTMVGLELSQAFKEMTQELIESLLATETLRQALEALRELYPAKTHFYRKRRTRSMKGK
jgi:hypothetical protein